MDISLYKAGITALLISVICTPVLIKISRKKGFYADITDRSSHDSSVPNTGGIILCFAILVPLIVFTDYPNNEDFNLLVSAFSVLLITGIIDDFNPIPVAFKFLGQFIPAIVIVMALDEKELIIPFIGDFVQLPLFFNYLFWIFLIIMAINAFNLIDGIDGLAIGMGIIGGLFYFVAFFNLGYSNLTIFALTLSLGLLGLVYFNLSARNKIFIGDTGSLLIGGILIYFALKFISSPINTSNNSAFFMVVGSIFIPLIDMIRVTFFRLIHKESPFKADRNHIHHLILDLLGGSHLLTTVILLVAQMAILLLFVWISGFSNPPFFVIILTGFLLYSLIAHWLMTIRKRTV